MQRHTDDQRPLIGRRLGMQQRCDVRTEGLPGRDFPEILGRFPLVRNEVHVPTEWRETFLLPLKEGVIITPGVRIGRGADHMHVDGAIPSDQHLPQHFEAADQELCLRANAIGEIIEPIIREIE